MCPFSMTLYFKIPKVWLFSIIVKAYLRQHHPTHGYVGLILHKLNFKWWPLINCSASFSNLFQYYYLIMIWNYKLVVMSNIYLWYFLAIDMVFMLKRS